MKNFVYVFIVLLGLAAASCTEESIQPLGEDDPVAIPPPPPKH